jgi:hypothetical protein
MTAAGLEDDMVQAFLATAEDSGCVRESEIEALATRLDLGYAEVVELRDGLAARGAEVRDDCGRDAAAPVYRGRSLPAPDCRRRGRAGQADRGR